MKLDSNPLENSIYLNNNLFSKDTCNTTNSCRPSIINNQELNIVEIEKQLHN